MKFCKVLKIEMKYLIKNIIILLMIMSMGQLVWGQIPYKIDPFVTPFGEFNFKRPQFPERSVNILDFGAQNGGEFKNTKAINQAIKLLSESGGGTVLVPAGKWLTGPIVLLNNINLHLEKGAELLFSQNFEDYLPAVLTNFEGSEVYSYSPFIYSFKQKKIAITGEGVLNGQGKPWWEHRKKPGFGNLKLIEMNDNEIPLNERHFDNLENYLPPVFFGPLYCENILLEGVTFKYGAFWTINPSFCENIIVRGITVLTDGEYGHTPNGDGINPNSCNNVLIEYNTISTGDDCITIKSGRNKDGRRINIPCKNILIRHNIGLQGHGGIVIGSEMSGGVENVYAQDCRFNGTDRVIRIKTDRGRGAYVRNCWFKDISADTIQREAIRINMLYSGGDRLPELAINDRTPIVENINYENIQCKYAKRNIIQIIGLPEMPVNNLSFKDIDLGGKLGIEIRDAKNIDFENLTIQNETGSLVSISYVDGLNLDNLNITGTDTKNIPILINDSHNIKFSRVSNNLDGKIIKITGNSNNIRIDKTIDENKIIRQVEKE